MNSITVIEQQDNNQFTFYDSRIGTILREFTGFEYPEVRASIDDVAGPYGSVYVASKYGPRKLSWQGDIVSPEVFQLRRNITNALRQTGVIKLLKFTTYDDLNLQCEAEITKYINKYNHSLHQFLIEATAPDWRFYSQEERSYAIAQTQVTGGFAIPAAIPLAISVPSATEAEVMNLVQNNGNEITDPVFTIRGPGENFTIGNDTTGQEFVLTYELTDSDTVVIDVKNRTVILNGVTSIYEAIEGEFWSLVPGDNELRFFVESGLTIDTLLTVTFRDAYGGI